MPLQSSSYRIPELGESGFLVTSLNEKASVANMNLSIAGVGAFAAGSWSLASGFESQVESSVNWLGDVWDLEMGVAAGSEQKCTTDVAIVHNLEEVAIVNVTAD